MTASVLTLLALPALVALAEVVRFHVHNRSDGRLVSSGERREYLLHVPAGLDASRPMPLVISMHGGAGWPAQQRDLSGWNRLADEHGFLVVYPSGREWGGVRAWRVRSGPEVEKDVRFIADLIDRLDERYGVDRRRVYANGLSNGGGMAFVLSCALSDRIAAVGTVAAARTLPWEWCTDRRPVPLIAFHGTADPIVPYSGGTTWVAPDTDFPDVPEWAAKWARRNRCDPEPSDSSVAADVTRRDYAGCARDATVTLFTVLGGGHTWPGGQPLPEWFAGPTTRSVDATREMWAFFSDHPLRD